MTTPPAVTSPQYLFDDEFNGAANAPPDPSKWIVSNSCQGLTDFLGCPASGNVSQNGSGDLVMQVKRVGSGFSGSLLATYDYGMDWPNPARNVKASFTGPYQITMRALMANTPGAWDGLWEYNTDRPASQHNYELDVTEDRMTSPTAAGCNQHDWVNGTDVDNWQKDPGAVVSNMATNWHTYTADVYPDHVSYYVDSTLCGTAYGVSGAQGAILQNMLGNPATSAGNWGSGGKTPAATDPGPWNMLVDYVRVSAL